MATLHFTHASKFSITGGIFSPARHVTMISGSDPDILTWDRDPRGRRRKSTGSRGSRRRPRTPSPSSSESSFVSDNLAQSRQSTPSTSVEGHESQLVSIPQTSHERSDMLSPLSSRLGAMHGLSTPLTPRPTVVPSATSAPNVAISMIPRPNEISASQSSAAPGFHRLPRAESAGTRSPGRLRPQGPRRPRPLPQIPHPPRFANPGTTLLLPSVTDRQSHSPDLTSWPSSPERSPSLMVSSPSPRARRPHQPIPFSRRSVQSNRLPLFSSYTTHDDRHFRSSPSQSFVASPIPEVPYSEGVTSSSRRSVQNSQPNHPFQSSPVLPQAAPRRAATVSRSHARATGPSQSSHQAFWPFQSFVGSMNPSEMNAQPPVSYQYLPHAQNSSNQGFIYTSSPSMPQYPLRSPYLAAGFAYLPQTPYLSSPQSHPYHYGSYNGSQTPFRHC